MRSLRTLSVGWEAISVSMVSLSRPAPHYPTTPIPEGWEPAA